MKALAIAILASVVLLGCTQGDAPAETKLPEGAGKAANPAGTPRNDEEKAMSEKMQQAGSGIADRMAKAAEDEKAAKAATGGK